MLSLMVCDAAAQRPRPTPRVVRAANVATLLPASDAVITIDVRRLFTEALPAAFAAEPAKLAQVNGQIDKLKSRTGVDPRSFDQLAVGLRYTYPSPGITKVESVFLARGKFDSAALVAVGRTAANGNFTEAKYKGATIYVFVLQEQFRLLGLYNLRINDLAVCVLDANTLAMGSPASVRAVIDAGKTGKRIGADVLALAVSDPNAIMGFGGNLPPTLLKNLDLGNDAQAKDLASIRQAFGAAGIRGKNFYLSLVARTYTPAQAAELRETATGLLSLGPLLIPRLPEPRKSLASSALQSLKVAAQGNELRITTEIPQAGLAAVIR
jgi:hypothetical protein